jgi:hypothetical protein
MKFRFIISPKKEFSMAAICNFLGLPIIARVSKEIITHEFEDPPDRKIYCSHFFPCTQFCNQFEGIGDGFFVTKIKDLSNGDLYALDSQIRLKCLALATLGIIAQTLFALLNLINRIAKIVSFAHFWYPSQEELSFGEKIWSFGKDVLRVLFAPFIFVMMELAALYGIIEPLNGRKLYAALERVSYGDGKLAPCFQPRATHHFYRGNLNDPDAW